jgi:hypothetical protein
VCLLRAGADVEFIEFVSDWAIARTAGDPNRCQQLGDIYMETRDAFVMSLVD